MGVRQALRRALRPHSPPTAEAAPVPRFTDDERHLVDQVRAYTLTSPERIIATADAVEHVVRRGIPGALAECGVWRGGSVLAMILTLQRLGVADRDLYLFDTFDGMTAPTAIDTSSYDAPAVETWQQAKARGEVAWPEYFKEQTFTLGQVRSVLEGTGYPAERLHFVAGPVEETLPPGAPASLALLRLDTDWYESTRHELVHLYPLLSLGGVLIIDDYGHWDGSRTAVDEYFTHEASPILLARIDYTGRIGVKS